MKCVQKYLPGLLPYNSKKKKKKKKIVIIDSKDCLQKLFHFFTSLRALKNFFSENILCIAKKTYSFFYLYHRTPPRNNWKPLQYSKNWKAKYSTKRSSPSTFLQNGTFCVCNDRFYQLFKTSSRQAKLFP